MQEKKAVFARAVNFGERSVALKKWWIETPINKTGLARFVHRVGARMGRRALADAISSPSFEMSSSSFPYILEPGRSFELILDAEAIQAKLANGPWNELTVVFEDEAETCMQVLGCYFTETKFALARSSPSTYLPKLGQ